MASKVKLGARPENFRKIVRFPMLDGTEGAIECIFKYRTRKEYGAFIDSLVDSAKPKSEEPGDSSEFKFSMADLMARTAGSNAEYLLQVLHGWNLDEPLSLASAQQLADEIPAAASAIMEAYRLAVAEGRLGN